MMALLKSDFNQGWYLTTLSSLLCVGGCFIIYIDDLYRLLFPTWFTTRHSFQLKGNYSFMNGSLGFSAGCLMFTALYRLLPEAMNHLQSSGKVTGLQAVAIHSISFIGGMLICYAFNEILHVLTSESVVHCSHETQDKDLSYAGAKSHSHSHTHSSDEETQPVLYNPEPSESRQNATLKITERAPLLSRKTSQKIIHFFMPENEEPQLMGECKGYSSAELCLHNGDKLHFCEIPQLKSLDDASIHDYEGLNEGEDTSFPDHHDSHSSHSHMHQTEEIEEHLHHLQKEHHHHHTNSPLSRLLLIAVQTILAITLHKFPEGFITYVTSETNPELGLSIFLSLLIHNFTEGFLMCLPLYYSFQGNPAMRKLKAVSISAVLGGLSQPLGALAGYFFMKLNHAGESDINLDKLNYVFGITMAVTSGFLTVIALTMFGSAVSFSGRPNFVMIWGILGMCVIILLNTIMAS